LPEVICNTSPFQYLHQLGLLHLLPTLTGGVLAPPAVVEEIDQGKQAGIDLPDLKSLAWVTVRAPQSIAALPLVTDLGPGETQVLALALESPGSTVIVDDALARRVAEMLGLRLTGTLGVLPAAKRTGLIPRVTPILDQLETLRFRLAAVTRAAMIKLAGES